MATDTPQPPPIDADLAALRQILETIPVAVYSPAHARVYRCPSPLHGDTPCERERVFAIPEAQLLAARIRAGEFGPVPPGCGPIILVYGIPWSA